MEEGMAKKAKKTSASSSSSSAKSKKTSAIAQPKKPAKAVAKPVAAKAAKPATVAKSPAPKAAKVVAKPAEKSAKVVEPAAKKAKAPPPVVTAAKPAEPKTVKAVVASVIDKDEPAVVPPVKTKAEVEANRVKMISELIEDAGTPVTKSLSQIPSLMSAKAMKAAVANAAEEATEGSEKSEKKRRKDELKIDRNGDLTQQWQTLFDKAKGVKPVAYKMSENYDARTALLHKVLGWGYVISSQNNRLEVLFKDGLKILIANYK
jgi:hypothetical protein